MSEPVTVLDRSERSRTERLPESTTVVTSVIRVREPAGARDGFWVAFKSSDLGLLAEVVSRNVQLAGDHRLVVTDRVGRGRSEFLRTFFRYFISADNDIKLLPREELIGVLASPERNDLLVGLAMDRQDKSLVVYRGSLEPVAVPVSFFGDIGEEALAHSDFEVVDYGQAVRFGDREASTHAILYAFDPEYRRRSKARMIQQDPSFGGALRRLRILRGLSREDFDGISSKEIARIERGEVEKPRSRTLELLARRLGVAPEAIETY